MSALTVPLLTVVLQACHARHLHQLLDGRPSFGAELSAFLEAEGWTVWYNKNLGAADLYRDEIMKQLAAARAVITIWTPNSIKSDWVRAEAGAAKAAGKLIPVKTPDVAYGDIPLPFGEMHTENVGSTDLIRAAVVCTVGQASGGAVCRNVAGERVLLRATDLGRDRWWSADAVHQLRCGCSTRFRTRTNSYKWRARTSPNSSPA
jgi:hypothetical protein